MSGSVYKLAHMDALDGVPTAVSVSGEIDATNADDFMRSIAALDGAPPVIVELDGLRCLNSVGFAAVDSMHGDGRILIVVSPDSVIHKAAVLLQLPFHHDVETARRTLGSQC